MAQTKGKFEVLDLKDFKLHVYYTNDALNDASYIVEGKNGLITLEQPLFKDNVAEFDAYVASLNKPVQTIITDYHVGGTGNHDIVMAEGMPAFTKGATYDGMMRNFAEIFGEVRSVRAPCRLICAAYRQSSLQYFTSDLAVINSLPQFSQVHARLRLSAASCR